MRLRQAEQEELWARLRRQMLNETSTFLSAALTRPELAVSIPIIQAGRGHFPRAFADAFWQQVLAEA